MKKDDKATRLGTFGCVVIILALATSAILSSKPNQEQHQKQRHASGQTPSDRKGKQEFWSKFIPASPTDTFTLLLVILGSAQVSVMGVQAWLFVGQLRKMDESLAAATVAAKAGEDQARLARDSLIASNRAWIKAEAYTIGKEAKFGTDGFSYAIGIWIKNVGNSPATGIIIETITFAGIGADVAVNFVSPCETMRTSKKSFAGISLFPGEIFPFDGQIEWHVHCGRTEVDSSTLELAGSKRAVLNIGGCITYSFPSDAEGRHQTRFIYEPRYGGLPLPAIDIPLDPEHLTLERSVLRAGNYAD